MTAPNSSDLGSKRRFGEDSGSIERLKRDLLEGLSQTPRSIPCLYLYDETGCQLYDQITRLPEYYPPRLEALVLKNHADEILSLVGSGEWVELGAGSAERTRILLDAATRRRWPINYLPTDASRAMLRQTTGRLRASYPQARIEGLLGDFESVLGDLQAQNERLLMLLGGTIGNLTDPQIASLAQAAVKSLDPGGHFLVGFDMCHHARKPIAVIESAYNDTAGVTAQFNLNLLGRLNREMGADFDLSAWAHEAPYNPERAQIEMYLRALRDQTVRVEATDQKIHFEAGERILTEISRKFDPTELAKLFAPLVIRAVFEDPDQFYGILLLWKPQAA